MEIKEPKKEEKKESDIGRRLGIFLISEALIRNDPEETIKIFKDMIVVRAESHYAGREIEYTAMSKHFDISKEGSLIPTYIGLFTRDEEGVTHLQGWEKVS